ncbi:uncharacterized protein LOC134857161 [Symsagittifera roscoffensis]|uniref:uncharacterized protein LOC134857161 n=1 Tax=Symsagittifera roscoffensis TaxID=84072 RepID=UPI00307B64C3
MIPNRQWMQSVPRERPLFGDAFRRANYYPNPVTTIVAVVNVFCATGTFTKSALGLVATPASYFFVYVFPSLKDATNSALDSMLDVALDAAPLRWICPIDDGFNPFDGLDVRFLNTRTVDDNNADHDLNIGINNVQNIDEFAHRKHI